MYDKAKLEGQIAYLLNKQGLDSKYNTPDFVLAAHLIRCLESFGDGVAAREKWLGVASIAEYVKK